MPLPNTHKRNEPNKVRTCPNVLGLYGVIDTVIERAHEVQGVENKTPLDSIRKRAWYSLYVHPKWMDTAIDRWVDFRTQNSIQLPISLEDELAIIFYLYLCHDDNKEKHMKDICNNLGIPGVTKSIIPLCGKDNIISSDIQERF